MIDKFWVDIIVPFPRGKAKLNFSFTDEDEQLKFIDICKRNGYIIQSGKYFNE